MTQLNSKSIKAILQEELNKDGDFLKQMVKHIIQQIMEEERDTQVGVLSHKRDNTKRKANRNGYKPRSFNTRVGNLLLAKPQIREFAFQTQLFENYQRSEKALLANICQMIKDGVSTNRVKKIVGKLSPDLTYSKSTVSRIIQELDPQIKKMATSTITRLLPLSIYRCTLLFCQGKPSGHLLSGTHYHRHRQERTP